MILQQRQDTGTFPDIERGNGNESWSRGHIQNAIAHDSGWQDVPARLLPALCITGDSFNCCYQHQHNKGPALGAGVQIQITGSFSTPVAAGDLNLFGRIPSQAVGSAIVTIADGQTLDVDLLLDFDKEAIDDALLTGDEISGQLLDVNFTSCWTATRGQ